MPRVLAGLITRNSRLTLFFLSTGKCKGSSDGDRRAFGSTFPTSRVCFVAPVEYDTVFSSHLIIINFDCNEFV